MHKIDSSKSIKLEKMV